MDSFHLTGVTELTTSFFYFKTDNEKNTQEREYKRPQIRSEWGDLFQNEPQPLRLQITCADIHFYFTSSTDLDINDVKYEYSMSNLCTSLSERRQGHSRNTSASVKLCLTLQSTKSLWIWCVRFINRHQSGHQTLFKKGCSPEWWLPLLGDKSLISYCQFSVHHVNQTPSSDCFLLFCFCTFWKCINQVNKRLFISI